MVTVAFRPLAADDFPGLVRWFAEPAVARWWGQPVDIDHVESTYRPRIEGREPTSMWIAEIDSSPSGLFQCYRHVDHRSTTPASASPMRSGSTTSSPGRIAVSVSLPES